MDKSGKIKLVRGYKRGERKMKNASVTDGQRVVNAMLKLQNGFLEARGISKEDPRLKEMYEVYDKCGIRK